MDTRDKIHFRRITMSATWGSVTSRLTLPQLPHFVAHAQTQQSRDLPWQLLQIHKQTEETQKGSCLEKDIFMVGISYCNYRASIPMVLKGFADTQCLL